jgi:hypothetical protein
MAKRSWLQHCPYSGAPQYTLPTRAPHKLAEFECLHGVQIGYYHVCGFEPDVLKGTDFAPYGDIYQGAWSRIMNAIKTADGYGIGVLIGACGPQL